MHEIENLGADELCEKVADYIDALTPAECREQWLFLREALRGAVPESSKKWQYLLASGLFEKGLGGIATGILNAKPKHEQ